MTALNDRRKWLAHLRECTLCPTDLCDKGIELHAAVSMTMCWDETWMCVRGALDPSLDALREGQ